MNKHKSNKIKENSNTVRHLIMGQIITTQNLVAIKVVRHAGQRDSNCSFHDDVIKWKHVRFCWSFVRGIHRSPVNSPQKGQWRRALIFSLICALNKRLSKQSWGWWFVMKKLTISWRIRIGYLWSKYHLVVHYCIYLLTEICISWPCCSRSSP